jgi:hypothetical protein
MSAPTKVLVTALADDGPTHPREAISAGAPTGAASNGKAPTPVLSPARAPDRTAPFPAEKFDLLREVEPQFGRTFEHSRRDKAAKTWTLSEFDLALASFAVHAGWDDAEIGGLIREHRKARGDADDIAKGERDDYIARTIAKARDGESESPEMPVNDDQEQDEKQTPDRKLAIANKLANLARGTKIAHVIERGEGNDTQYDIHLENGECVSVTEAQLYDPRVLERRFRRASGRPMDWLSPKEWKPAADAIGNAAKSDGVTDGEREETLEWLASFIAARSTDGHTVAVIDLDNAETLYTAIRTRAMFRGSDGRLYMRSPALLDHVVQALKQRTTTPAIRQRLGRLGFTKPNNSEGKLTARHDGESATGRYLASPVGFEVDA